MAVSLRPLIADVTIHAQVGIVVNRVALGQVVLRVSRFSAVRVISPWLHAYISSGGMNSRPVASRTPPA
jgi:hypothetical protein